MQNIVVLGAGTAGTVMANRLADACRQAIAGGEVAVTVVDPDDWHVYQPGLLFLPFGRYAPDELLRHRAAFLHRSVTYVRDAVDHVDPDANRVHLRSGNVLGYDVLLIATGSHLAPERVEGMTGPGWQERVFDFYTLEGATALREALAKFAGGRLVVHIAEMPIKCPVAPLEFAFLADAYFTGRGIRDQVEITYVTPLDGAFTRATRSRELAWLLDDKRIALRTDFAVARVDGAAGTLTARDDTEIPFDLLVTVPPHKGAAFIARTAGLGDGMQFVRTDPHTLQARRAANIFAIGDATDVPASKAGFVAHFEAEPLTANIQRLLAGRALERSFDGRANCFVETGHGKALLIDFNNDLEPVSGGLPFAFGPTSLPHESRLNHLGKLAFRWVYWHLLLPGRHLPGLPARMSRRGKRIPSAAPAPRRPAARPRPARPPPAMCSEPVEPVVGAGV